MRIASIDIGTNTVLLLVADVDEGGGIQPVLQEQRLPRLGRDVDLRRSIPAGAFDRGAWVVNEYKNLSNQLRAEIVVACATSAVRDASNREEFLAYLTKTTGITVSILDGDEEALWTHRGAVSALGEAAKEAAVIDIGGGSTELSYGAGDNGERKLQRWSLQLGSVRITERYLKHTPATAGELRSASDFIVEELAQVRNPGLHRYTTIGVAGTVTTLACLDQGLPDFQADRVNGYILSRDRVANWLARLSGLTPQDIRSLSAATEGRSDILTGGVLILSVMMDHLQIGRITASDRGLRYGLILREWEKYSGIRRVRE